VIDFIDLLGDRCREGGAKSEFESLPEKGSHVLRLQGTVSSGTRENSTSSIFAWAELALRCDINLG
jgi:hypothetical protein